ncbi:type 1 glutamine amidotransferase [Labrenzia sp. 011]|uniref:type 1 glutamine amidotransferase n=1 Tax=Labrenzia sp. 011 TaxID=2171494 RepID=UPI000D511F23|nr:type 1 glutamine amidotransferase [Labrenzia sp. 011]PVB63242.1 GMP synthase [Labrenzia sp. 011]
MTFLVIENYPETGLGLFGRTAAEAGKDWTSVQAHLGEPLPRDVDGFTGLVVLGGAQDALADDAWPHLPLVCDLIRTFHAQDKPVLGICLGSQLIARAFGGGNILGRPVEFGWREVVPTEQGREDRVLKALGDGGPQFHWHSDTVTLPDGAVHLAKSAMTPLQAFRMGRATYAIQFHLEIGLEDARAWTRVFAKDIRRHTPDWDRRFETQARLHAARADSIGTALSSAWLALL